MRQARAVLGTLLMVVGLGGFGLTQLTPRLPAAVVEPLVAPLEGPGGATTSSVRPGIPPSQSHEITRLVIASIGLDTPVSVAPLVDGTWAVPKFVAGHAEGSPGAGEPGNAILMGHVTSLTLGNVFEHLDEVAVDDTVSVFSGDVRFDYRVTDASDVDRGDLEVLDATSNSTLTLITCSGWWLPTVHDYNQRFVVRADLIR